MTRFRYLALFAGVSIAQNSCYYAAEKRAGSLLVPCGGSSGYSACCQTGDLCLSDSACWNPQYNVTYLYGCNDPTYQDPSCPWKCGPDFESSKYVGLDYCYNTTKNEWSCTHPPANSDAVLSFPAQECFDDSIIAFAGPSVLQPILSLPTDIGGSTVYFSQIDPTSYSLDPGYTPTTTSIVVTASVPSSVERVSTTSTTATTTASVMKTTSSAAPIAGVTGSSNTSSSSSSSSSSDSSGLSTGAKIGIGVGVAGGVLALIAIGLVIFMRKRRRNYQQRSSKDEDRTLVTDPSPYLDKNDYKEKTPRPPSELPADAPNKVSAHLSSNSQASPTVSSWDSPVPTYRPNDINRRPVGSDTVHELP